MSCSIVTSSTSAELDSCSVDVGVYMEPQVAISSANNDEYVTAPLIEVLPSDQSSSEEEIYTSFEEAINGRSSALHNRYSHLALSTLDGYDSDQHPQTTESSLVTGEPCHLPSNWQHFVVLISLPLNFLLAGFDLMGWLVLHMR